jgi:hypothetical protein
LLVQSGHCFSTSETRGYGAPSKVLVALGGVVFGVVILIESPAA